MRALAESSAHGRVVRYIDEGAAGWRAVVFF